jgi:hypothetical protein
MNKGERVKLIIAFIVCVFLTAGGYAIAADTSETQPVIPQPTTPQSTPSQPEIPSPETKHLSGYKYSGFLSDYSMLKPAPDGNEAMV